MKRKFMAAALAATMCASVFAGSSANAGEDVTTVTWFASRPVDGPIDLTIRQLAAQYSEEHDGTWQIDIQTEADRPSYLEKLKTLIAGGNMPDIIDIDATPYCRELVDAGYLVDVKAWMEENGLYDAYLPVALGYQEFTNGDMYTLPLELNVEMVWYRTDIFEECGITETPKSLNEWLGDCKVIAEHGYTPISVDGADRWPVLRYLAMAPYAQTKNDYAIGLAAGENSMGDETGVAGLDFYTEIGQYFQEGFATTDYATAQSMFLNGESAMYYIGTWEFGSMNDAYNAGDIDYFYVPSVIDGEGDGQPFCINSGIGMAFNSQTFDEKTADFISYVIDNYAPVYASYDQLSPIRCELPEDHEFSDLYVRVSEDIADVGADYLKPWDCYFDADTCTVVEDNMLLLPTGDMDQETFIEMVDSAIDDYVNE